MDKTAKLWDLRLMKCYKTFSEHTDEVEIIHISILQIQKKNNKLYVY